MLQMHQREGILSLYSFPLYEIKYARWLKIGSFAFTPTKIPQAGFVFGKQGITFGIYFCVLKTDVPDQKGSTNSIRY